MPSAPRTPGRPQKYGRPARLVPLTLPEDVLKWLGTIHPDPAWAIVNLYERGRRGKSLEEPQPPTAELVPLPNRRALIVVRPQILRGVDGVSFIPLSDGRALLSLADGQGVADLELALIDRLAENDLSESHRQELESLRELLRKWRQTTGLTFRTRSIIVADRSPTNGPASAVPRLKAFGRRSRQNTLWFFSTCWYDWCELGLASAVVGQVTRLIA
jgi:hypothetical protein